MKLWNMIIYTKKDILINLTILILYQQKIKFELYVLQATKLYRNCIIFHCMFQTMYMYH